MASPIITSGYVVRIPYSFVHRVHGGDGGDWQIAERIHGCHRSPPEAQITIDSRVPERERKVISASHLLLDLLTITTYDLL